MSDFEKIDLSNTCLEKGCLDGQVAVVTGSTSNVGKGFVRALAWAGAKVVVSGRNAERGQAIADDINQQLGDGMAIFVQCDVTKEDDVANLAKQANEAFGKVDILINNAMNLALNGTVLDSPIEDLDMSYAISARGSMLAIKAFVPDMIKRGHGVVAYSTTQFNYMPPMIGGSMYTAGKAAATSLTMSLANEVNGTGVNVFCWCPAGVGAINPESVEGLDVDPMQMKMPGWPGLIPADASGAAMVYSILHADELHGSGVMVSEALTAMDYPYPVPETAVVLGQAPRIEDPMAITMMFLSLGKGFPA